ncbi:MAG TPA: hypothetical protein PLJ60_18610 [Chryseolinea sp.]|nr:hypothetical protein [Chryseolinea sp.]HPM32353.1 hypothetical protein [Chryseolinea sp.]
MANLKNHWLITVLPLLGISFWFLIAFPFANRNESYIWIAYFDHHSFIDIVQNQIPSVRNFRPLAQIITWCLYHLSGGNSILIQLVNYIILCAAIWIIVSLTEAGKMTYARILYFLTGFTYISAFYYVFNLHGIFYSPILLIVALLLRAQDKVITHWKLWSVVCLTLSLFHPIIIVLYAAYLSGWLFEKYPVNKKRMIQFVGLWIILLITVKLLIQIPLLSIIKIQNLLGTIRNVEAHIFVKLFSLALCLLTLANKTKMQLAFRLLCIIAYIPFAFIYQFPFLLLLAFLIALNLMQEKKWALLGLMCASIIFPLVVGSGAPTKASIFIFIVPYLILQSLTFSKAPPFRIINTFVLATLSGILVITIIIRVGIQIPLISTVVSPILVEKGKTFQLEKCISLSQTHPPFKRIQFLQTKAGNIRDMGQPQDRDYFPPAKQSELDVYQKGFNTLTDLSSSQQTWYLSFGELANSDSLKLIYTLDEINCRPAYIYSK